MQGHEDDKQYVELMCVVEKLKISLPHRRKCSHPYQQTKYIANHPSKIRTTVTFPLYYLHVKRKVRNKYFCSLYHLSLSLCIFLPCNVEVVYIFNKGRIRRQVKKENKEQEVLLKKLQCQVFFSLCCAMIKVTFFHSLPKEGPKEIV